MIFYNTLFAVDVSIDEVEKRVFSQSIEVNSQVIQLPSAKEQINAQMGGKVVRYTVKEGDMVQEGQVVAEIRSLELASYITEIKGLEEQLYLSEKNYKITKKLYNIGVESLQNLNRQEEERGLILSQINTLKSKLSIVGAEGDHYKLYAHCLGWVREILSPLNSVVTAETPLIGIVKGKESFLIKSFIPLKYATKIRVGQKGSIRYGDREYGMKITQILPNIDQQTQKMTILSKLDKPIKNLFVNTFLNSKIFFGKGKSYLTVKKSALSFFNNEWVVFVPEHHDDEHKEHAEHEKHESHKEEEHHDEKEEHKGHGHDEHEEEEVPYDIKVVKILKKFDDYVAIEGLNEHEDYVSDKSYYIKSLLLKSSLGGHGH
jgi:hypothetical protein